MYEKVVLCPLINFPFSEIIVRGSKNGQIIEYFTKEEERIKKGVELLKNIRIRRIKIEDINKIKRYPFVDRLELFGKYLSPINLRTFVIEFLGKDDKDWKYIEEEIEKIILAMRLYKPISVFCKNIWFVEKDEVKGFAFLDLPMPNFEEILFLNVGAHGIKFDELEEIANIVKKIAKVDFDSRKSFRIACERFNRVFEKKREDDMIIDCMIAFEALFVKKEIAGSSIKGKIARGCSDLLGKNALEKEEILTFLKAGYQIRNSIVHGSEYSIPIQIGNKKYEKRDFVSQLQRYLSESIMKKI